jgi:hypothetical protein
VLLLVLLELWVQQEKFTIFYVPFVFLAGAVAGLKKHPQLALPLPVPAPISTKADGGPGPVNIERPPTPWGPLQRQQRGPSWPPGLAALRPAAYLPGVPKVRGVGQDPIYLCQIVPNILCTRQIGPGVPKVRVTVTGHLAMAAK